MTKKAFAEKLLQECGKARSVAIMGHKSPDFDCIGSCVAMHRILQKMGITADIFVDKELDNSFTPIITGLPIYVENDKKYDLVIVVDCSDIGSALFPVNEAKVFNEAKITFKIDHHISGKDINYATYNYVDEKASSACEIIFYMFKDIVKFDNEIAKALYLGIYTDTGGFKYSNATSKTFGALAKITKYDFAGDKLVHDCVSLISQNTLKLTQIAFQSIKFFHNNDIVVSTIRNVDFVNNKCEIESCKFMPSYLPNIDGVKIAISITEKIKNEYNISLRTSCDNIDVAKIASRFNGGGHIRASGLTLKGNYDKALNALILECIKEIK